MRDNLVRIATYGSVPVHIMIARDIHNRLIGPRWRSGRSTNVEFRVATSSVPSLFRYRATEKNLTVLDLAVTRGRDFAREFGAAKSLAGRPAKAFGR
jgi:hypothetical protein